MKRDKIGISPEAIAYLHGRIDKEVELFAASTLHCTAIQLTEELGELLLSQRLRIEDNVSTLRENPSTGSTSLAKVEMVSSPHRNSPMSPEARAHLSKIAKERWANMSKTKRTRLLNKMLKGRTTKSRKK